MTLRPEQLHHIPDALRGLHRIKTPGHFDAGHDRVVGQDYLAFDRADFLAGLGYSLIRHEIESGRKTSEVLDETQPAAQIVFHRNWFHQPRREHCAPHRRTHHLFVAQQASVTGVRHSRHTRNYSDTKKNYRFPPEYRQNGIQGRECVAIADVYALNHHARNSASEIATNNKIQTAPGTSSGSFKIGSREGSARVLCHRSPEFRSLCWEARVSVHRDTRGGVESRHARTSDHAVAELGMVSWAGGWHPLRGRNPQVALAGVAPGPRDSNTPRTFQSSRLKRRELVGSRTQNGSAPHALPHARGVARNFANQIQ